MKVEVVSRLENIGNDLTYFNDMGVKHGNMNLCSSEPPIGNNSFYAWPWQHYQKTEIKNLTICVYCSKIILIFGDPSSMMYHLKQYHAQYLAENSDSNIDKPCQDDQGAVLESIGETLLDVRLTSLERIFRNKPYCRADLRRLEIINEKLCTHKRFELMLENDWNKSNIKSVNERNIEKILMPLNSEQETRFWKYLSNKQHRGAHVTNAVCYYCRAQLSRSASSSLWRHVWLYNKMIELGLEWDRKKKPASIKNLMKSRSLASNHFSIVARTNCRKDLLSENKIEISNFDCGGDANNIEELDKVAEEENPQESGIKDEPLNEGCFEEETLMEIEECDEIFNNPYRQLSENEVIEISDTDDAEDTHSIMGFDKAYREENVTESATTDKPLKKEFNAGKALTAVKENKQSNGLWNYAMGERKIKIYMAGVQKPSGNERTCDSKNIKTSKEIATCQGVHFKKFEDLKKKLNAKAKLYQIYRKRQDKKDLRKYFEQSTIPTYVICKQCQQLCNYSSSVLTGHLEMHKTDKDYTYEDSDEERVVKSGSDLPTSQEKIFNSHQQLFGNEIIETSNADDTYSIKQFDTVPLEGNVEGSAIKEELLIEEFNGQGALIKELDTVPLEENVEGSAIKEELLIEEFDGDGALIKTKENKEAKSVSNNLVGEHKEDFKWLEKLSKRKGRSNIWKYFKRGNRKVKAACRICGKMCRYGNTSNLWMHFILSHPKVFEKYEQVEHSEQVQVLQVEKPSHAIEVCQRYIETII